MEKKNQRSIFLALNPQSQPRGSDVRVFCFFVFFFYNKPRHSIKFKDEADTTKCDSSRYRSCDAKKQKNVHQIFIVRSTPYTKTQQWVCTQKKKKKNVGVACPPFFLSTSNEKPYQLNCIAESPLYDIHCTRHSYIFLALFLFIMSLSTRLKLCKQTTKVVNVEQDEMSDHVRNRIGPINRSSRASPKQPRLVCCVIIVLTQMVNWV